MRLKKWFENYILNEELSHQERLIRPLFSLGLIGAFFGIVASAAFGESLQNVLLLTSLLLVVAGIILYSIYFRKIQFGTCAIGCIIVYLILPLNFFTGGGIYGGVSNWFIFGIVCVCLVVEGTMKYILLGSSFVISCVCYGLAYLYPDLIMQHDEKQIFIDSFSSLIIVVSLVSIMVLFQNRIFHGENELAQKQKKKIEELNRAQNNFFSSMSHEIRTPINTIIGLNEMILREDVSEEVAENARNIQNASKMLLSLINDILDMSKMESGKMDIVPTAYYVGDMLSDVVNMIWVRAKEKGLEFHVDIDPSMPVQLFGDEVRIKQIMINLLNNAVKYTQEGSVTLSIQCQGIKNGKAEIIYSVADTGLGIKKEHIPHLFSAFRRMDETANRYIEGTGLGLSIVKQLVVLMGGDIAVNSVYTKGSTFVVTLPQNVVDETAVGELNLETRHAMNTKKHYKRSFEAPKAQVLIVDDNETNLMVAEKLLRDTKVQITCVTSAAECLKETLRTAYHMIFMDHLMPEMDGVQCFHAIREQAGGLNRQTSVVILTANAGSDNQEMYRREGFDGYLLKPVSGNQLEAELMRNLPRDLVTLIEDEFTAGTIQNSSRTGNKKAPIIITADNVCDLPKDLLDKHKIGILPAIIITDSGEFLDGEEADSDGILAYLNDKNKVITSDVQKVEAYEAFFAEQLTKAHYVIHICLADKLADSYKNSIEAAKVFDNVRVIDSKHISTGMGLVVLYAAQLAEQGYSPVEIEQKISYMRNHVATSFVVNTTEYLRRNGRVTEGVNALCSTLMIHPVLMMKNGKLAVMRAYLGTRSSVWKNYINHVLRDTKEINTDILFLTYAGLTSRELEDILLQVKEKVNFKRIVFQKASSAISINCGQGSFGLIYYKKE